MRVPAIISLLTAFLVAAAAPVRTPQPAQFPITFGTPRVIGAGEEFGSIIAAQVGPNGNVYALDHMNVRLVAFSPQGHVLWRFGRKGRGPGEFQVPYRLAVRDDNSVLVYDFGTREVTAVSARGEYLTRYAVPFRLRQVDDVVAPNSQEIIIVGTGGAGGGGAQLAAHRFQVQENRLKHVGSFAPLPVVRDPRVLGLWGAGSMNRMPDGELIYTRRLPYEIYGYSPSGQQRWRVRSPLRANGSPDDAYRIEQRGVTTQYSGSGGDVTRPLKTWKLADGRLLSSHRTRDRVHWDLLSPTGTLVGSWTPPEEWGSIVGFDPARRLVWLSGTRDDEPVLYQMTFSLRRS
jgi:hypothetical protein